MDTAIFCIVLLVPLVTFLLGFIVGFVIAAMMTSKGYSVVLRRAGLKYEGNEIVKI